MWRANWWERTVNFLFFSLAKKIYRIKSEGSENLEKLRSHLEEEGGSAIIVFNHISLDDILIIFTLVYFTAKDQIKRIGIAASRRHWRELFAGRIMRIPLFLGMEVFPVVQHYEREKISREETSRLDRRFLKGVLRILVSSGGLVILAPEGHRGNGRLQNFQSGIGTLVRKTARKEFNTLVFPIGVIPEGKGKINSLANFGKSFMVRFGPPIIPSEIEKESLNRQTPISDLTREKFSKILSEDQLN